MQKVNEILARGGLERDVIAALKAECLAAELVTAIRSTHGRTRLPFPISGNKERLSRTVFSLRRFLLRDEACSKP